MGLKHSLTSGSLLLLLSVCSIVPSSAPNNDDDFQFVILKQNWHDLQLGYHAAEALARLKTVDASGTLLVLNLSTIDRYDWNQQTITLTQAGTEALVHALAKQEAGSARIKILTELKQSLGWSNPLERALYIKGFVVRLQGEALYAGIFLDATSQMAIDFPVARVSVTDGKARIALLPIHIPFVTIDPAAETGKLNGLSIAEEAQVDAQALDQKNQGFSRWLGGLATSEMAKEFRQLIRDGRTKQIFDRAGKLKK